MCPINVFSEAVMEMLLFCKHGIASWRVYPLKLTTKHILTLKHVVIVIVHGFIMVRRQNGGCH